MELNFRYINTHRMVESLVQKITSTLTNFVFNHFKVKTVKTARGESPLGGVSLIRDVNIVSTD